MKSYKILVTSVDPWSDEVGSDTLSTLLSRFDSNNVSSLNIRARKSNSHVAKRYFHILEGRVLKSIFSPRIQTGEEYSINIDSLESVDNDIEQESKRYSRRYGLNRWILVLIREFIWKIGKWKSKQLDDFVESVNPDILFFPIEGYIHFNRINKYIIKKYQPKRIVGYMWDDNFTYKQCPRNPFYILHRLWLRRSVKWLISNCDTVFAISPKMKRELDLQYGINSILLTKPLRFIAKPESDIILKPIKILYAGKLGIGRDETLVELIKAINIINSDGTNVVLDIYTGSKIMPSLQSLINSSNYCEIHGFIPQSEVFIKQQQADVLLFVESLTSSDLSARLSFSTKITDYLSLGKCIWAIGNLDLAPIGYLKGEDAALVSFSRESILSVLQKIIDNPQVISEYACKAYKCGDENHNREKILTCFESALTGVVEPIN